MDFANDAVLIERLKDLVAYSKDCAISPYADEVWSEDAAALECAIKKIERADRMLAWIKEQEEGDVLAAVLESFGYTGRELEEAMK